MDFCGKYPNVQDKISDDGFALALGLNYAHLRMFIFYKRFCSFCAENESACSFWFALGWLAQPSQGCERLQSVGVGLAWQLRLSIFGIEIGIGIDHTTKSLWCFKSYVCHWTAVVSEGGTGKHLFFGLSSRWYLGLSLGSIGLSIPVIKSQIICLTF